MIVSDTKPAWPDAIIDIGPIEISDHRWGIVGLIPYDGHVVLEIIGTSPAPRGTGS